MRPSWSMSPESKSITRPEVWILRSTSNPVEVGERTLSTLIAMKPWAVPPTPIGASVSFLFSSSIGSDGPGSSPTSSSPVFETSVAVVS